MTIFPLLRPARARRAASPARQRDGIAVPFLRRSGPAALLASALLLGCGSGEGGGWELGAPHRQAVQAVHEAMGPFLPPPGTLPGTREPLMVSDLGYDHGAPDALVTVFEFSDFGCGYCRRFHQESWPILRANFIDTGLVRWKFVPFSIGMFANGEPAARAGICALEQDRFPEMQWLLFERQREWQQSSNPTETFLELAESVGMDPGRFDRCLDSDEATRLVQEGGALAGRLGVRGTPTFFVDGQPVIGALPTPMFADILERLIRKKREGDRR